MRNGIKSDELAPTSFVGIDGGYLGIFSGENVLAKGVFDLEIL